MRELGNVCIDCGARLGRQLHRGAPYRRCEKCREHLATLRKPKTLPCQNCEKRVRQTYGKPGGPKLFCDEACRSEFWKKGRGKEMVELPCLACGEIFLVERYSRRRLCSIDCGSSRELRKAADLIASANAHLEGLAG